MKTQTRLKNQIPNVAISLVFVTLAGCAAQSTYYPPEDNADVPEVPGINIITSPDSPATDASASATLHLPEGEDLPAGTDVVIRPGKDRTLHEYYVNGQLHSIRVVPAFGPPYNLVAFDPIGTSLYSGQPQILIPSWKIAEFE